VRQERIQWLYLQGIVLERKGFKAEDYGWLDDLEHRRWSGTQEPLPAHKDQRQLFAEARARPITDEDRRQLQLLSDGDWQSKPIGGRNRSPGSPKGFC
jgi:hypothetical protein